MENDDDNDLNTGMEKIKTLVGRGKEHLVDRIIQLVVADTHYTLAN